MLSRFPAFTAALAGALLLAGTAHAAPFDKGPYLQLPTPSGIIIRWVSDTESAGQVEYAPARGQGKARTAGEMKPATYHRVQLSGLKPYTLYRYTVTSGGEKREGTFRTAAPPTQKVFKFVAYGDTRTNADVHSRVLDRVLTFHPDFILQTGDLVENGTNEALWTIFFNTAEKALKDIPYYPGLGNHERSGAPYFRYFDAPRDYSFDYGTLHVTVLDSNRPASETQQQDEWLKQDLAAHQNATWRIVAFHHTPYTCVDIPSRRVQSEALRKRLEPIFLAGKVQLVINGHDHTYQHHFANGIHYIVTGGGGAPLYKVRVDTPFTKVAKSAYHDCEISVNGNAMHIRVVEPDGAVIEEFDITTP